MDEEYDVVILGTGLKECVLNGMLSVSKKKVLHLDRNKNYGGKSASITPLGEFFKHFGREDPRGLGSERDWNVDLIPKFMMANGQLVKLLILTGVTRFLEFKSVEGSYVYNAGKIHKVPASEKEVLESSLMGTHDKTKFKDFLIYVNEFDEEDPKTWKGFAIEKATSKDLYTKFGLSPTAIDIAGHAMALYRDDSYLQYNMKDLVKRIKLYTDSLAENGKSPYLYPLYGLGELPQNFARLSAIYGGTFMLDMVEPTIIVGEEGKVIGVRSGKEMAKCKVVVCDPSYADKKIKKAGKVVRAICILNHDVPMTNSASSFQVIIPQNQVSRKSDIYVTCVSSSHNVAAKGFYLATVSTTVETAEPEAELKPGLDLLGPILHKFVSEEDLFVPTDTGHGKQARLF